jgi:hypothetical protein
MPANTIKVGDAEFNVNPRFEVDSQAVFAFARLTKIVGEADTPLFNVRLDAKVDEGDRYPARDTTIFVTAVHGPLDNYDVDLLSKIAAFHNAGLTIENHGVRLRWHGSSWNTAQQLTD